MQDKKLLFRRDDSGLNGLNMEVLWWPVSITQYLLSLSPISFACHNDIITIFQPMSQLCYIEDDCHTDETVYRNTEIWKCTSGHHPNSASSYIFWLWVHLCNKFD